MKQAKIIYNPESIKSNLLGISQNSSYQIGQFSKFPLVILLFLIAAVFLNVCM